MNVGDAFGRLTVVELLPGDYHGGRRVLARAVVRCECGARKTVKQRDLNRGHTTSCGCLRRVTTARQGRANRTHGESSHQRTEGTAEYRAWHSMKVRTTDPNCPSWKSYGGRGISTCPAWLTSFETFLRDMGRRPPGTSLDRINNDGNYEPTNCRWADASTQAKNQRPRQRGANGCWIKSDYVTTTPS